MKLLITFKTLRVGDGGGRRNYIYALGLLEYYMLASKLCRELELLKTLSDQTDHYTISFTEAV